MALLKRWIIERTFARLGWSRHLSKDDEWRLGIAETRVRPAVAHRMLRRLAWFLDSFLNLGWPTVALLFVAPVAQRFLARQGGILVGTT
ncbi:hypothetical protein VSS37_07055, partial [Candidatus Thiothrix sp. Deng01]|nr:hypothetical protein [Candidatus Thiothrix sp. Deng01]